MRRGIKSRLRRRKETAGIGQRLDLLLGPAASPLFGAGLLTARRTFSITAPLVAAGVFGWPPDLGSARMRLSNLLGALAALSAVQLARLMGWAE